MQLSTHTVLIPLPCNDREQITAHRWFQIVDGGTFTVFNTDGSIFATGIRSKTDARRLCNA